MKKHLDNPAGRLFLLMKKGSKIDKQTKMKDAWAEIVSVDPKNTTELLRKIGIVNKLPSEIRSCIHSIKNEDHELYLRNLSKIERALGKLNFNARWNDFHTIVDETAISSLEFTSNLLSKKQGEASLNQEEIENLLDLVNQFKKELIDSAIPEDLKKFILERLIDIEAAVFDYELSGITPIKVEIERSVGSLIMRRGIYSKDKKWTEKFFKLLSKIATIVSFTNDSQTLIGSAKKLLGS